MEASQQTAATQRVQAMQAHREALLQGAQRGTAASNALQQAHREALRAQAKALEALEAANERLRQQVQLESAAHSTTVMDLQQQLAVATRASSDAEQKSKAMRAEVVACEGQVKHRKEISLCKQCAADAAAEPTTMSTGAHQGPRKRATGRGWASQLVKRVFAVHWQPYLRSPGLHALSANPLCRRLCTPDLDLKVCRKRFAAEMRKTAGRGPVSGWLMALVSKGTGFRGGHIFSNRGDRYPFAC